MLADLAELSVLAWFVLMGACGVIGLFVGACLTGRDETRRWR
jgi:hypothetical protein